jgi:hypothetical protein
MLEGSFTRKKGRKDGVQEESSIEGGEGVDEGWR